MGSRSTRLWPGLRFRSLSGLPSAAADHGPVDMIGMTVVALDFVRFCPVPGLPKTCEHLTSLPIQAGWKYRWRAGYLGRQHSLQLDGFVPVGRRNEGNVSPLL